MAAPRDEPRGILHRFWRSVFRAPLNPRDDTDRKRIVVSHLFLHNRPVRVSSATVRYTHTFGLGGMSIVLFGMLAATGVLLMFVYEPSPGYAYDSIVSLRADVFFGRLVRNVHYWSANLLIVVATLHLVRVYLTGAYYGARQLNWVLGLALLLCAMGSNFTGYLLPWDQLSYWATTIVTGMLGYAPLVGGWLQGVVRGGDEIGAATLVGFYAAHTTLLPVLIVALMALHFWRVRKAGGVVVPRAPGEETDARPEKVLFLPHLLLREFAVALCLVAFVLVLAVGFDAPLGEAANPGMSPNPAKAPWYFAGFQELLLHFDPLFAVVVLPLLAVLLLLSLPYLRYDKDTSGVLLMSREGRRLALAAALVAVVATPLWILADETFVDLAAWMPGVPPVLRNGLLPAVVCAAVVVAFQLAARRRAGANNEAVQASFVLLATVFLILTIAGFWFRGPGMALVWPWAR